VALVPSLCRVLASKKAPLWLCFKTAAVPSRANSIDDVDPRILKRLSSGMRGSRFGGVGGAGGQDGAAGQGAGDRSKSWFGGGGNGQSGGRVR
jgi:hypothetical protein